MTGTPSIIAGLFIYILWVFPHGVNGKSGFVAAVTLSVMMIPVTCRAALEVIRVVPGSLREAALAIGAPQWRVALRVVLPTARAGLITAAILGVARTAGETAEVLFTAGGGPHYNWNPFHGDQDDLPLRIYEQVFQPSAKAISVGWGAAFVLMCVGAGLVHPGPPSRKGRLPPVLFVLAFLVVGASEPTGERMKSTPVRHLVHQMFVRAINSQRSQFPMKSREDTPCSSRSMQRGPRLRWGTSALVGVTSLLVLVTIGTPASADTTGTTSSTRRRRPPRRRPPPRRVPLSSPTPPVPPEGELAVTPASIAGNGSSFAAPAVNNWADDIGQSPYNLTVSYTPSSSGQGRYEFTNKTVDYAVSDTGYVDSSVGTTPPTFPFDSSRSLPPAWPSCTTSPA